jgi:hypothetical protein
MRDEKYVADMRAEANARREQARGQEGETKDWLLSRAAFFDACADEAEAEITAERV